MNKGVGENQLTCYRTVIADAFRKMLGSDQVQVTDF